MKYPVDNALKFMSLDEVIELAEECVFGVENTGICLNCGHVQDGCEPDAEGYRCENCGEEAVMGAPQIVLSLSFVV